MSDFYKKFLTEEVPRAIPGSNKQVFLGAFGKHPGWDDHVEDLGLETGSLIQAKIVFYVQGIGGEIDAGAWEKLEEPQRLPAFKHVFVWHRAGQLLLGRLWSSRDGKGRTRYPMVVVVHCSGVSLSWALDQILPRLEQIEQACLATSSAADVRSILARYRADLRAVVSGQTTDLGPPTMDTEFITNFAARPELGPRQEGWMRLLYAVQNQFAAFARGKFNPKADASTVRPQQIRVPRAAESPAKAILQWANFFVTQVEPLTPTLLTVPLEEPWIDVTLGEPTSQELFCLRATPKAMPLASEVPYNLSEEFRARCRSVLAALESGRPPGSSLASGAASAPAPSGQASTRNRFLKWFGGGAAVFLTAAVGAWFAISHKSGPASSDSRQPESRPAEFIAAARQPPETAVAAPPAAPVRDPISPADDAAAKRLAEENRLARRSASPKRGLKRESSRAKKPSRKIRKRPASPPPRKPSAWPNRRGSPPSEWRRRNGRRKRKSESNWRESTRSPGRRKQRRRNSNPRAIQRPAIPSSPTSLAWSSSRCPRVIGSASMKSPRPSSKKSCAAIPVRSRIRSTRSRRSTGTMAWNSAGNSPSWRVRPAACKKAGPTRCRPKRSGRNSSRKPIWRER